MQNEFVIKIPPPQPHRIFFNLHCNNVVMVSVPTIRIPLFVCIGMYQHSVIELSEKRTFPETV